MVRLLQGDCLEVMATLPEASIDAVVTDPPYGLGFMGRQWDTFNPETVRRREVQRDRKGTERVSERWPGKMGTTQGGGVAIQYDESSSGNRRFQDWCELWATECLRVLKPGEHLLACGGPRTFHRLTAGIEDAGFEIRDCLTWLYGSGFPKSHNLVGEWQGWGTALKPAWEPIVLARKRLVGTVAANVEQHGVGAINVDGCRVGEGGGCKSEAAYIGIETGAVDGSGLNDQRSPQIDGLGRWPANVCLDEAAAAALDDEVGVLTSGANPTRRSAPKFGTLYGDFEGQEECAPARGADAGGPSRFFYCAKADRAERNAGLDELTERPLLWSAGEQNPGSFQSENTHRAARNHHPTVKPVSLMRWLVRLVTLPAGTVLDPFMGSGTTGIACVYEEFGFIGIEREAEYLEIARRRIERAQGPMFAAVEVAG